MNASTLSLIYAAGLAQAAFLVCALASMRVRHTAARWLLVATIVVLTTLMGEEFLTVIGVPLNFGLGLAVEFALAPLLYLFVRTLLRVVPFRPEAWHFAPLGAASLILVWLNLGFADGVSLSNPAMRSIVASIVLVKIGYFFLYATAILRLPLPVDASPSRLGALKNLLRLFFGCVLIYALNAASFIAFVLEIPLAPDSDVVGGILIAATLYAIGYFALVNREVFDLRDPYETGALSAGEAAQIRTRTSAYLAASGAFLDPEFGLRDLVRALGLKPALLSQALNADQAGGFKALVNRARIEAYFKARAEPQNQDKSTLELAFAAGFNSKATFYRVLKAVENERLAPGLGAPSVAPPSHAKR
jgi:AraC-like DNA-binding protein